MQECSLSGSASTGRGFNNRFGAIKNRITCTLCQRNWTIVSGLFHSPSRWTQEGSGTKGDVLGTTRWWRCRAVVWFEGSVSSQVYLLAGLQSDWQPPEWSIYWSAGRCHCRVTALSWRQNYLKKMRLPLTPRLAEPLPLDSLWIQAMARRTRRRAGACYLANGGQLEKILYRFECFFPNVQQLVWFLFQYRC